MDVEKICLCRVLLEIKRHIEIFRMDSKCIHFITTLSISIKMHVAVSLFF